jgi:hypothetical protein
MIQTSSHNEGEFMKIQSIVTALAIFGFAGVASAQNLTVKEVAVSVTDAYIPSGFDSKSEAYVVVNGLFPNTCYALSEPKVDHKTATSHEIQTMAKVTPGICIRVFVPFNKEISLGYLATGKHNIKFLADDGTYFEKSLVIE